MIGFMYQEKLKTLKSCLTDTGASKTLISEEVYKKIPEDTRTKLSPATSLRSADNSSIQEYGKAVFEVELGGEKLQQEVVVANISNEGLLGMDILHNSSTKPADIMLQCITGSDRLARPKNTRISGRDAWEVTNSEVE